MKIENAFARKQERNNKLKIYIETKEEDLRSARIVKEER